MPVERIIDFCNQLDVDISNFFIQGGEAAKVHPELMKKTHIDCKIPLDSGSRGGRPILKKRTSK